MFAAIKTLAAMLAVMLLAGCGGEPTRYYAREFSVEISGAETLSFNGGRVQQEDDPQAYWLAEAPVNDAPYANVLRFEHPASGTIVEILGVTTSGGDFGPQPSEDGKSLAARLIVGEKVYDSQVVGAMDIENVSFASTTSGGRSLSLQSLMGSANFTAQSADGETVEVQITYFDLPINVRER